MKNLPEWSKAVKARDKKCQECGTDKDLHAHHIIPKAERPDLTLDLSNGKALCYRCHKQEHERNRTVRIRSENPHKATIAARLKALDAKVKALVKELDYTKVALKTARAELKVHGLL